MKEKIDIYFAKKGIETWFNTLGHDEEMIYAYLFENKDLVNTGSRRSENHKTECYNKLYKIEHRAKRTGFENIKKQDREFRKNINPFILESQFSDLLKIDNTDIKKPTDSYKELLRKKVTKANDALLYLSGGVDSELVANAFVDAGVKFIPVIYEWVDKSGNVLNGYELQYAYKFCKTHSLIPIIKSLDIESLWKTEDFKKLAIDSQLQSPQLVTYAYIIDLMSQTFPNSTHVFGGEVRFYTDHLLDDGRYANIVYLQKIVPGYNDQQYSILGGVCEDCGIYLIYYSNGFWQVAEYSGISTGTADSGSWYSPGTPTSNYEIRVTQILVENTDAIGSYISPSSADTIPTSWQTIISGGTVPVAVDARNPQGTGESDGLADGKWVLEVRKQGTTTPVISSNILLTAVSRCFN